MVLAAAIMSTQAIRHRRHAAGFPAHRAARCTSANENHGQWIVTAYMTGMGVGQLFWGADVRPIRPAADFARRPRPVCGRGAAVRFYAAAFTALLAWRFVHGLAAACVTVTRSVIRDLYSGRQMARVMSLTFVVFLTVPISRRASGS